MVSYAQNGEDVVLDRAFGREHSGFYVDVGAGSPLEASVTRHFYEHGWHGINIEPVPEYVALLQGERPRDRTVAVAAGAKRARGVLFVVLDEPGLSTLSEHQARLHEQEGHQIEQRDVDVMTLDALLAQARPESIDFVKIDVEGSEREVLEGLDLCLWRPRVIVIEATRPNTRVGTHKIWEHLITAHAYDYASTDGLNRYYVRQEDAELCDLLGPANCLDNFVSARDLLIEEEVGRLRDYVGHVEAELAGKESNIEQLEEYVEDLSTALASAVGAASDASPAVGPAPPDPDPRIAIISTPRTGATYLRTSLAGALGVTQLAVRHPADLQWETLPDGVVLQLHWRRSLLLAERLADEGFEVVTLCRHPLDVLLSMLRFAQVGATHEWLDAQRDDDRGLLQAGPASAAFLRWATGPRAEALLAVSSDWWDDPSVEAVRYEALVEAPGPVLQGLMGTLGREIIPPLAKVLADSAPERPYEMSGGSHVWDPAPGKWKGLLPPEVCDELRRTFARQFELFDYDVDRSDAPTREIANDRWAELGFAAALDDGEAQLARTPMDDPCSPDAPETTTPTPPATPRRTRDRNAGPRRLREVG